MADAGAIAPTDRLRRSPIYRVLQEAGAEFTDINGAAVAFEFAGAAGDEIAAARMMALADLSPLPRVGCKGSGALDWVRSQGIDIGADNNFAYAQPGGEAGCALSLATPVSAQKLTD